MVSATLRLGTVASSTRHPTAPAVACVRAPVVVSSHAALLLGRSVEEYGELGERCAPVYLAYGLSVLAEVRAMSDPFGLAVKSASDEQAAARVNAGAAAATASASTAAAAAAAAAAAPESGGAGAGAGGGAAGKEDEGDDEAEGEDEEDTAGDDGEDDDSEAPEDKDDLLELSWQLLELARVIYSKSSDEESRLQLARVYATLGDHNLENEQMEQAASDYQQCLDIRTELLDAADRRVADAHVNVAIAARFAATAKEGEVDAKMLEKSIMHYQQAAHSMTQLLLQSAEAAKSMAPLVGAVRATVDKDATATTFEEVARAAAGDDASDDSTKEIFELASIVDEVNSTIVDLRAPPTLEAGAAKAAMNGGGTTTIGFGPPPSGSPAQPPAAVAAKAGAGAGAGCGDSGAAPSAKAEPTTTIGFGSGSTGSSAPASSPMTSTTLQPRRKPVEAATDAGVKRRISVEAGDAKRSRVEG